MTPQTEDEELEAACQTIGRALEDIKVEDFRWVHGDVYFNYMATWGDYDLDCVKGTGRTPEEAMWELIDTTSSQKPVKLEDAMDRRMLDRDWDDGP